MAYDLDPIQNHCYPGTTVLVNKYGIRQQKQLDEVEALVVSTQIIEFELSPFLEPLSFDYYKQRNLSHLQIECSPVQPK